MGGREGSMVKKPDEMVPGQEDGAERKTGVIRQMDKTRQTDKARQADKTGQTDRTVRVKERQQSRNSRFVTLPGLSGLLFFAVLATYYQVWTIAAFLMLLFCLCISSFFWSRVVLKKVEISVAARQNTCHVGERLVLEMKVRNRSFLPLVWLDVILPAGHKACIRQAGEEETSWFLLGRDVEPQAGIRERFVWLLWQQEIAWEEELDTLRRGVAELAGAGLQAGDGFGLSARESWYSFQNPLRLVIWPKLVPVSVQPFLRITQEAVAASRGQTEDITLLKSIRPYQPGDSVKRINWRLLAGTGRMEVNRYETVRPGCTTFLLDLVSFRQKVKREGSQGTCEELVPMEPEREQMISLVASCMESLAGQGLGVALVIPEYKEHQAVICVPGREEPVTDQCMEALARIDYQKEDTRFPYEEFWQTVHKLGQICICTRTDQGSSLDDLAEYLGRSRVRYLALERQQGEAGEFDWIYRENICDRPSV